MYSINNVVIFITLFNLYMIQCSYTKFDWGQTNSIQNIKFVGMLPRQ